MATQKERPILDDRAASAAAIEPVVGVGQARVLLGLAGRARVIDGNNLVPMMAMRLARPTRLIDIDRIVALSYIRADAGAVSIGATTPQCLVERDALIASSVPLLARAIPLHRARHHRARGTIGGSLANADPAAELPLIAVTLDAVLSYRANGQTEKISMSFTSGP